MMMFAISYGIGAVVMALVFSRIPLMIGRAVAGLAIGILLLLELEVLMLLQQYC